MKRFNILLGMVMVLSMSSCDFLKEDPKTFMTPEMYYENEDQMQDAVNGMYPPVFAAYTDGIIAPNHNTFIMLETITGYHKRTHPFSSDILGYNLPLTDDNPLLGNNWNEMYTAIARANSVIKGITESKAEVDESVKAKFLGEAHFIRAYSYFFLVQLYGPVPMPLTPTTGKADIVTELTNIAGIYEQILADLTEAETLMADLPWHTGDGHVSKGAVKSLLAKVYLTMAGYPLQDTAKYEMAYAKAKEVRDSGAYSLYSNPTDIAVSGNRNKKEAIFTSQYKRVADWRSPMHCWFLPFYDGSNNEEFANNQSFGGALVPSSTFINTYEPGDKRAEEKQYFYNSYNGIEFPQPFVYKYFDEAALAENISDVAMPLMRYSDILLVMAEAKCAGGTTSDADAIQAYYDVRNRYSSLAKPASISFNDVYLERVWELCFEDQAWFDMLRTRKTMNANGNVVDMIGYTPFEHPGVAFTEEDLLFPYPVAEKRLNSNLSGLSVAQRLAL